MNMKRLKFIHTSIIITLAIASLFACKKEWLDIKPDKSLVIPNKIEDFQALLDNTSTLFNLTQACGQGELSAGDFYVQFSVWQTLSSSTEKFGYTWANTDNYYNGEASADWNNSYKRILYSNIILEGIEKIQPKVSERVPWNNVKGSALFFKSFDLYNLTQQFCQPYSRSNATNQLGLPLREEYDVNVSSARASLQETYDSLIQDLKTAATLLPSLPLYKTRPSKQAVYALLARTYLSMEMYEQSGLYADSALQIHQSLLNYNSLNSTSTFPIERFNTEVIFHSSFTYGIFANTRLLVDTTLFMSYSNNDLRKKNYFTPVAGGMTYKGSYTGSRLLFGGLATDEMLLTRAECSVRKGDIISALSDLNKLLETRFAKPYQEITANDPIELLNIILKERRKELIFRGLRWSDLRRLNRDERFKTTLFRNLNGTVYSLLPNDKKYVLPIDEIEIRLSGIQQNER